MRVDASSPNGSEANYFRYVDQTIGFFDDNIRTLGNPDLAGPEDERLLTTRDGRLITNQTLQRVSQHIADSFPGELQPGAIRKPRKIDISGSVPLCVGSWEPETYASLIELAHAPATNAWIIDRQSRAFSAALAEIAAREGLLVVDAGCVPTVNWKDFSRPDTITRYPMYQHWCDMMDTGVNVEQCATIYGTAGTHESVGFNDPKAMATYTVIANRVQPTMIAMLGNSPIWDGSVCSVDGRPLLSRRSYIQIAYGDSLYGKGKGVNHLYPDFVLNTNTTFIDLVLGYMALPLGRTSIADPEHNYDRVVDCGNLTMLSYLNGFNFEPKEGITYYPTARSLYMMQREHIVDVRVSMMAGPRVEARSHDCALDPAVIDAFYRGLAYNREEAIDLLGGMSNQEIRLQRERVCFEGLRSTVTHVDDRIKTQRDLALRLINVAARGLHARGLGELKLLAPLEDIVRSGRNPAERMLEAWHNRKSIEGFLRSLSYRENRHQISQRDSIPLPIPTHPPMCGELAVGLAAVL